MSILGRLVSAFTPGLEVGPQHTQVRALGDGAEFIGLDDPYLLQFLQRGQLTRSGTLVNRHTAMGNATFFRAVSLICSSVGMLPCHLMEQAEAAEEGKPAVVKKATGHPLFNVLHKKPNSWQTPFEWKTQMQFELLATGAAYGYKKRDRMQRVTEVVPLPSRQVKPELADDFSGMSFLYTPKNGVQRRLSAADVFWIRAPITHDGVNGLALIDVAAEALGLATAAERAQGSIFKNGSIVGGVLSHPKTLSAPAIERLRQQFEERHSGSENAGKWIVAEEGLAVDKGPQSSGRDAQAVEARKLQVEEIGRITGVPRPLLMVDETSWGSGIEQLGLFFVIYCLMPWLVAWEEAINRSLLADREQGKYFAKFNEGALLRGSLKDQAEFFSKALGAGGAPGWMSGNEVRDKFNLAPQEGLDEVSKGSAGAAEPNSGGNNEEIDEPNPPQGA